MCEHHHEHHHNHKHLTSQFLRITSAVMILAAALLMNLSGPEKFTIFFIAYLIAGSDVLFHAIRNIFKGEIFDENFLMSIATIGAFSIGEYPEAIMVMVLYQIGEMFQEYAVGKSRKSITELMDIRPDYANIEVNNEIIKVTPDKVQIGDIIVVKTGEKLPLDGVVVNGSAILDTTALTGESKPRTIKIGDNAVSGCINTNGLLKIKVTKEFKNSTVSKILELVEHTSSKKATTEKFITKFARYYTPAVVAGAVLLAVLPPLLISGAVFTVWLERALTFLVISCPCALVISVPLGFFAGIGGASRCGILIKGSSYVETLSNPETVVFDKTGTLTKGNFKVTELVPALAISKEELLETAVIAEYYSNHPIAVTIKEEYKETIDKTKITDYKEIAGNGVQVNYNGHIILAGNMKLMKNCNIDVPSSPNDCTVVYIAKDEKYFGAILISDEIKTDSECAIKELKKNGIKTVMLTGDKEIIAAKTAEKLGIDKVFAELLPNQKVEQLENLIKTKRNGKSIIFVGDGINDAPVLTRADVGISMGALGTDAAIEAADVVIMDDMPSKIPAAIKISKQTMSIVKQNIVFALGVKGLFLILGAFGIITMWGAVFADVGVTVIAVINSLRALKVKDA